MTRQVGRHRVDKAVSTSDPPSTLTLPKYIFVADLVEHHSHFWNLSYYHEQNKEFLRKHQDISSPHSFRDIICLENQSAEPESPAALGCHPRGGKRGGGLKQGSSLSVPRHLVNARTQEFAGYCLINGLPGGHPGRHRHDNIFPRGLHIALHLPVFPNARGTSCPVSVHQLIPSHQFLRISSIITNLQPPDDQFHRHFIMQYHH